MNYITEILAFYDYIESNPQMTDTCICLWHALMYQANKTGWKSEFSVAISTLELRTGLKRNAVYTARNKLKQFGLINFNERAGNLSSVYKINSLVSFKQTQTDAQIDTASFKRTQSETQPDTQSETQYETHTGTINKQNEIKQNKTIDKTTSYSSNKFDDIISAWNALNLTQIKMIQGNREDLLNTRTNDYGVDGILQAIENISKSKFLRGQNNRNWVISFDWFIKPGNFPKVLEGNYTDKPAGNTANSGIDHELSAKTQAIERKAREEFNNLSDAEKKRFEEVPDW